MSEPIKVGPIQPGDFNRWERETNALPFRMVEGVARRVKPRETLFGWLGEDGSYVKQGDFLNDPVLYPVNKANEVDAWRKRLEYAQLNAEFIADEMDFERQAALDSIERNGRELKWRPCYGPDPGDTEGRLHALAYALQQARTKAEHLDANPPAEIAEKRRKAAEEAELEAKKRQKAADALRASRERIMSLKG